MKEKFETWFEKVFGAERLDVFYREVGEEIFTNKAKQEYFDGVEGFGLEAKAWNKELEKTRPWLLTETPLTSDQKHMMFNEFTECSQEQISLEEVPSYYKDHECIILCGGYIPSDLFDELNVKYVLTKEKLHAITG